jgi:hypothetical protein
MFEHRCAVYEMPTRHCFGGAVRCARLASEHLTGFRVCREHAGYGRFVLHDGRLYLVTRNEAARHLPTR